MSIAPPKLNQVTLQTIREEIFSEIKDNEAGLTDEEIQLNLGFSGNTERPRRGELVKQGLIRASGTRVTQAGRQATVWVANDVATPPQANVSPKQVTVTHTRGGKPIRTFKTFLNGKGREQTITFPELLTVLSGDTLTIS